MEEKSGYSDSGIGEETMPPSFSPAENAESRHAQEKFYAENGIALFPSKAEEEFFAETGEKSPDSDPPESTLSRVVSGILELLAVVAVALICAIFLKTYLIQPFEIPSESMANTLIPGDRIMVNKLADSEKDLQRGDVVVFVDPGGWLDKMPEKEGSRFRHSLEKIGQTIGLLPQNSGHHLVKRIIGMPGDTVECCSADGKLTVNGTPVAESYLPEGMVPSEEEFSVQVPAGHLWVMGDNRSNSKDSRFHQKHSGFGFVPIDNLEGRAWLRIYPFGRWGRIPDVSGVFSAVPAPSNSVNESVAEYKGESSA